MRFAKRIVLFFCVCCASIIIASHAHSQQNANAPTGQTLSPAEQQILAQLDDIILPEPISWWPLSPQLLILMMTLSIALLFAFWRFYLRRKRNQYRRIAIAELQKIKQADATMLPEHVLKQTTSLLKRCYLSSKHANRLHIASLYGVDLFVYLASIGRLSKDFSEHFPAWERMAYQSETMVSETSVSDDLASEALALETLALETLEADAINIDTVNSNAVNVGTTTEKQTLFTFAESWIKKHRLIDTEKTEHAHSGQHRVSA